MDETQLLEKEEEINTQYRAFLEELQTAFNRRCDEIKSESAKKLETVPESDQETRQKILADQQARLDKTLVELKQVMARKEAEVRVQLEEIADLKDRQEFNVDDALAKFGTN